ncbi:MAG: hypothetical protein KAR45_02825 [Desulfobacteraceae bacterium]|nr:hypothetical protein [Desulfobacteraceae bacterium]
MSILSKLNNRGFQYWLPYYFLKQLSFKEKPDQNKPIHLFLCIVDHFEPFNGNVDYKTALERVKVWKRKYPQFADQHRDIDGKPVQHTWFYPPHLDHRLLPYLVELCQEGYGDIEMHLHHNHMKPFPDTSKTLKDKILKCIDDYGKFGIFRQSDGFSKFAFIHGDWSLDNSGGDHLCGINNELTILNECGCYADFTFPCLNQSQPAMVNSIYYAFDDETKAKSYNRGLVVAAGKGEPENALLMIQGIIGIRFDKTKKIFISIENSDLDFNNLPTPERVDYWVANAISIKEKSNWKFIKLHTHGAPEERWPANFGCPAHQTIEYLETKYNNEKYKLHYVTAREMYNLVKCAESGQDVDPSDHRDFIITPYPYEC